MGGTFMALPEDYRDYFIRNLHDALSGHTSNDVAEAVRYERATVCVTDSGHSREQPALLTRAIRSLTPPEGITSITCRA